jgi:hypothetical protein
MKKLLIFLIILIFSIPSITLADEILTEAQKISLYVKIIEHCDKKYPSDFEKFIFEKACRESQLAACLEFFELDIPENKFTNILMILQIHGMSKGLFYDVIDWEKVLQAAKEELSIND